MQLSYRITSSCASVINSGISFFFIKCFNLLNNTHKNSVSPNPYRKHLLLQINHTFSGKLLQRIRFWGFAKKTNIISFFGCGLNLVNSHRQLPCGNIVTEIKSHTYMEHYFWVSYKNIKSASGNFAEQLNRTEDKSQFISNNKKLTKLH